MTSDARKSQMPILPLVRPVSRRISTVYGISIGESGLELRREVLGRARNAVLVRPAVRFWGRCEITVRGRRRRRPLECRGLPRILPGLLPLPDAPEEIEDERNLEEGHDPGAPGGHGVHVD